MNCTTQIPLPKNSRVHMLGIGGAGMSGLAIIMSGMGYTVSGSDLRPGVVGEKLAALGIKVFQGHDKDQVSKADLVVASAAVSNDNPELIEARDRGIPVVTRAQMLGRLMLGKTGIAVAGTHGKTTTTSILAVILEHAGLDPTILIGGDLNLINGNAKLGHSDLFLTEACEAFNSFLELFPKIAVVTSIEADHLDCHGSLEGVKKGFRKFLSGIESGGFAVMCADCPNVREVIPSISSRVITYGTSDGSDCRALCVDATSPHPVFKVKYRGQDLGEFRLNVPGIHNVRNALSAIAVGMELGIGADTIREVLLKFDGAKRRFEILGTASGITVVDDYAHHPTEVSVTLQAARSLNRRIIAVFQPHLYSRTQLLASDFAKSLSQADSIIVTEIYPSREKPIPGVSAKMIADMINYETADKAKFIADKHDIAEEIIPYLKPDDLVIVMGAGDIRVAAESLLNRLGSVQELTAPIAGVKES